MKIKPNNIKKFFIGSLIVSTGLALSSNMESLALKNKDIDVSNYADLSDIAIVKNSGIWEANHFSSVVTTSDGGFVAGGQSLAQNASYESKGDYDAILIKYDKYNDLKTIKNYGGSNWDKFESVIETSDGGFVAVGWSQSADAGFEYKGRYDAIIVKCDKDGNQEWIKSIGGSRDEMFNSVIEASDGNFVVVGYASSTGIEISGNGSGDAVIIKYDKDGNELWTKSWGGSDSDSFDCILETSDKGFVVVGYSYSTDAGFENKGRYDAIIAKYDKDGNQQWVKNFGGSNNDYFKNVKPLSDGGFIVAGCSYSTNAGFENKGDKDAIMAKYDKDGNQQWVKNFGGNGDDEFNSIVETLDGGFVAVGDIESTDLELENKGETDSVMIKYDKNGNQLWIKYLRGSGYEKLNAVTVTSNNEILAVGNSDSADIGLQIKEGSQGIIVKYSEYWNKESTFLQVNNFQKGRNLDEYINWATTTTDGGFVVVGESNSINIGFDNKGDSDAIIVKYNKNGSQEWIRSFGGNDYECFYSVATTVDGGFVAVGECYSTDAGFETNGEGDGIIVKYDKYGNQQWVKVFGGSDWDLLYSVSSISDGGFVAVGESYSIDAGFEGDGSAIIVKYDKDGNQQWIKSFGCSGEDYFYSVATTLDEGFVAVGYAESTDIGFEHKGGYDAIIVKYDKDGNQEWVKNFGGSDDDEFYSIVATLDGGFVAVGESWSTDAGFENKGDSDAIIVKYDKDGNQEWIKSFGDSEWDEFYSITSTVDRGFIAVGNSYSDEWGGLNCKYATIVKYDKDGNQEWTRRISGLGHDVFKSGVTTLDGGFIAVGYSESGNIEVGNAGENDALIVKYDKDGNKVWMNTIRAITDNPQSEFDNVRANVNKIENEQIRRYLNEKLNKIIVSMEGLEPKTSSANLDIYIKSENMLLMNLSTNSITFDNYSGVDEIEKTNALNISINSSLPYQLNAYLVSDIKNADGSNKIDIDRLNIKDNTELSYSEFSNINEKLVLKDNCNAGNDKEHSIDLKLKGGNAYPSDIYKTVIKFEAEQK